MPNGPSGSGGVRTGANRSARAGRPIAIDELVFVCVMVALGIFAFVGILSIRTPPGITVGPTVFPIFVAAILLGSAVVALVGVLRGRRGAPEEAEDIDLTLPTDWATLAKIIGFVVAHLLLIPPLGWAPAAAVLFGGVAWSLGAKRWWVALLIGLAVGLVVQIAFGGLLGLSLPWGPALEWLGRMF